MLLREAGGRYINVLYDLATEGIRALAFHREQLEWKVLLIDQVDRIHTIVCHMLFGSGPLPSPVLDDALRALDGGTASPLTTPDPPPAMGKVPCDHPAAERESWVGWLVHHCRKCGASIQDRP